MPRDSADSSFVERLSSGFPADMFARAEQSYLEEPRGRWQGARGFVARPRSTEEVSDLVKACNEAGVGIVPYGGGTGLVGGQIAPEGEPETPLILSLERMTRIRAVYPQENVLIADAGVILANIQAAAAEVDRLFPLSLASEGSARIGGLLGTNAGGVNVLRYGNTRDLCLGLEAVLPDGRVWNGLKRLRKDNTGYDLRNLLIGSEGTLGVITGASLKLFPRPASLGTAVFVIRDAEAALELLSLAKSRLGESISAFELMHRTGLDFLAEKLPDVRRPFGSHHPEWMILMDIGLPRGLDPQEALETLFVDAEAEGIVTDAVIAQSEAQRDEFWAVREQIPEANRRIGAVSSHDVSVPLGELPSFIARVRQAIAQVGDFRINCFGHVGDGNLHFNVFPPEGRSRDEFLDETKAIKRLVHDISAELGGTFSAEHGVGRAKKADLERYGDPVKLAAMRAIKDALDPKGIMNPGAVLP
ncbi:FAD-binding oxidoreductase [Marivita geojedonensis]|uniref:2-hydroxyacid dehydrogenase n=1 Tax=Marivita geojedonensis TaxID=1123756 RepID=A0A1X4NMM3_9RHOB|nr:FAD-binding oxidoreductase [Marivita geojedonensis]OSQ51647.1 2-hydroxyacid dehydrogenase [Marivita geojedonensis]PRY79182.1 FAD/FMN-containing dehydrogenase [Marivita geojedonensis]